MMPIFGLYGEGLITPDAKTSYYLQGILSGLPLVGPAFNAYYSTRDKVKYMDDYMSNTGLDYADIQYPTMTAGYQGISSGMNFVSSNVERLYR